MSSTDDAGGRSTAPVAWISGGASGMGLAVVKRLIELGYNVTIVDVNEESGKKVAEQLGEGVMFVKANVADYDEQASTFVETWTRWGRLDVVYANAGIGDRTPFYDPAESRGDGSPPKPNTFVIDVCLNAMVYSAYLALHYFRKTKGQNGKLIFTSSMAGLYPAAGIPLYAAAKHGIVGLTRSLSMKLKQLEEPITVNCICPGLVSTGLTERFIDKVSPEYVTPVSTIVKAFEGFLKDESMTGQAAECSKGHIYYRTQPEWSDEEAKGVMTENFRRRAQEEGKRA